MIAILTVTPLWKWEEDWTKWGAEVEGVHRDQVPVSVSVEDGMVALGKAHTRSAPSLSSLPKVALETGQVLLVNKINCGMVKITDAFSLPTSSSSFPVVLDFQSGELGKARSLPQCLHRSPEFHVDIGRLGHVWRLRGPRDVV